MRTALLLCLVALDVGAQGRVFDRPCEFVSRRSSRGGVACGSLYAAFEFAPASGVGMGAACAGTTPTGVKGETLTFSRASARSCMKGSETTGIVAGDLVTLTSGQPAVMPGGNGTGGLGLSVWGGRTNLMLFSALPSNAAWTKQASITVSAADSNCPMAPDNSVRMDLVTFGGAGGVFQNLTVTASVPITNSVFLAMKSGGAACSLFVADSSIGTGTTYAVPASGISRFSDTQPSAAGTALGGLYLYKGANTCTDACVWGGQTESQASTASPYIATTGTAVARVAEVATFPNVPGLASTGSAASTILTDSVGGAIHIVTNADLMFRVTAGLMRTGDSVNLVDVSTGTLSSQVPKRFWTSWTGSALIVTNATDSVSTSGTFRGTMGNPGPTGVVTVGGEAGRGPLNGVIKKVCIDSSPTRCR